MSGVKKVNRWCNIPGLTRPMDLAIPSLVNLPTSEKQDFCAFLADHPLAHNHNKKFSDIEQHVDLNIRLYTQGKPFHH